MIRFSTLGAIDLVGDEGQQLLSVLSQPKRVALLAYLAVAVPDGFHRRDRLVATFWPDLDTERARAALRKSLHFLRRALGSETVVGRGDEEVMIERDALACDANDFRAAVAGGDLVEALDLYRGPFLDGFFLSGAPEFEHWVDEIRSELHRMATDAAWRLADSEEEAGNQAGALSWGEKAVALSPDDEPGVRRLMGQKLAMGDAPGALHVFERFATRLDETLGMEPGPETVELAATARDGGLPPAETSPAPTSKAATPVEVTVPPPEAPEGGGGSTTGFLEGELAPELELLRPLGKGSVAYVHLARDVLLERLVAVKVMDSELAKDKTARRRFEREARSAAQISHRNVTRIHRIGHLSDGVPYIVMEYVEGRTLADVLAAGGPRPPDAARQILAQVAAGLAAAHEQRIVHRDVRPGNVLQEDATGRIVLTDFGLARILDTGRERESKLTIAGEMLGDPGHISPEQILGEPVTDETDVYSLGVLGYELLTGRGPYTATSLAAITRSHLEGAPPPLAGRVQGVDDAFSDLLVRCLAKKPEHRPRAADVVRALSGAPAVAPGAAAPPAPRETPARDEDLLSAFLAELRRRKVYQVGVPYAGAAVLVLGLMESVSEPLGISILAQRILIFLILGGFPLALVLSWMYDITGRGIERTGDTGAARGVSRGMMRVLQGVGLAVSFALVLLVWWLIRA